MELNTKFGLITITAEANDDGTIIIPHDTLIDIADKFGFKNTIKTSLLNASWLSERNFSYVFVSSLKYKDQIYEAIGETNSMMPTGIGKQFPAIMAHKRAIDRVIVMALGIDGKVYSDIEINQTLSKKKRDAAKSEHTIESAKISQAGHIPPSTTSVTGTKPEDKKKEEKPAENLQTQTEISATKTAKAKLNTKEHAPAFQSIEQAEQVKVSFGNFKNNPITLKELKEDHPEAFTWLLMKYNISKQGNRPNDLAKKAALYIVEQNEKRPAA